jgi:hypothetical protein
VMSNATESKAFFFRCLEPLLESPATKAPETRPPDIGSVSVDVPRRPISF